MPSATPNIPLEIPYNAADGYYGGGGYVFVDNPYNIA